MKAKFEGKCRECGGLIYVGDNVKWLGRGKGVKHADEAVCDEVYDYDTEQRAEMRFELGCAAHMAGTSYVLREQGFEGL